MQLQTIRPNIVQSIRAHRVEDLQEAAAKAGYHFLYANVGESQTKQDVLECIAESFTFPVHFGKNLDALYDCMTDVVNKAGPQPGFVVVLEQLPDTSRFDRETREQLLDVFRDAADFWAERKVAFRCFYSFAVNLSQEAGQWDGKPAEVEAPVKPTTKASKAAAAKGGPNPNFGMNMPMMSSAFDTAAFFRAAA